MDVNVQGIGNAVAMLERGLTDMAITQMAAIDHMHYILELQAEQSPSALASSPILLYARVRVRLDLFQSPIPTCLTLSATISDSCWLVRHQRRTM